MDGCGLRPRVTKVCSKLLIAKAKEDNNMEPDISYSYKSKGLEEKRTNTRGFELFNLRCSSIAGLWITFSFPLNFKLICCASKVEIEHII